MLQIIKITGKAKDVFACLTKMASQAAELTIGEIARLKKGESKWMKN